MRVTGQGLLTACWRETADDLGNVPDLAGWIAWVFALRRESQMKIFSCLEPGANLQHLAQVFIGRAGIRRGFQYDEHALLQMTRDVAASIENVRDIRLAIFV